MKLTPVMVEATLQSSIGSKSVWSVGRTHTTCDEHFHVHAVVDQLREAELAEHFHELLTLRRFQEGSDADLFILLCQILKNYAF